MKMFCTMIRWICVLLLTIVTCRGLQFELDITSTSSIGSRDVCAVLRCVEDSQTVLTRQDDISTSVKNISSLTVFRKTQSTSNCKNSSGLDLGIQVASLTPQKPRLSQVADGIKVEGVLESGRASLTLEMAKSTDCLADFACQVRSVAPGGEESVSLSRVLQGAKRNQGVARESSVSPLSLRVLELVLRMDAKLTLATKSTESLENKVEVLENNLNTKLAQSTERLESKTDALKEELGEKSESLLEHLVSLQNRIEDKLEDGVEDKIGQVHMAIVAFTKDADAYSESVSKSLNESLTSLSQNLKQEQEKALKNFNSASQNILDIQNNATDVLLFKAINITQTQTIFQDTVLKNIERAVDRISENEVNISRSVTEKFSSIEQEFFSSFHYLSADFNRSVTETQFKVRDLLTRNKSTYADVRNYVLLSNRCANGMTILASREKYPYSVIQPEEHILDIPFLCDTVTDGGGWIIIQRRSTGDVNFFRGWNEYKNGFGDLGGDFWLGNDNIHKFTSSGSYELRVELEYKGKSKYARYGRFSITDESSGYVLTIDDHSGTAGDSLVYSNGKKFSTYDRDNDMSLTHCAARYMGAWWYKTCSHSNLNGKWQGTDYKSAHWQSFSGRDALSFTEMKIRRL